MSNGFNNPASKDIFRVGYTTNLTPEVIKKSVVENVHFIYGMLEDKNIYQLSAAYDTVFLFYGYNFLSFPKDKKLYCFPLIDIMMICSPR